MDLIYGRWHHLLTRYNHDLLSPPKLLQYAQVIEQAGAALDNCWGFVDGTARPVCRPRENQRVLYHGHKRVHSIKFQAVALPNGLDLQRFSNCPVTGDLSVCTVIPLIRYEHTYKGPTREEF